MKQTAMKPFAQATECPKCGCRSATSRWWPHAGAAVTAARQGWLVTRADAGTDDPLTVAEHIERKCAECGFRWAEAPKDAT